MPWWVEGGGGARGLWGWGGGRLGWRTRFVSRGEDAFDGMAWKGEGADVSVFDGRGEAVVRVSRPLVVQGVVKGCRDVKGRGPGAPGPRTAFR